jgi:hypothetical protein
MRPAAKSKRANPYLNDYRLSDVLAALQFFATYKDYDLTVKEFCERMPAKPVSADSWRNVFDEHPEFFRQSERGRDYSLVLRRAKSKEDDDRPPLSSSELSMLVDTAINLQKHAIEIHRERRAKWPIIISGAGAVAAFAGALLGVIIKG